MQTSSDSPRTALPASWGALVRHVFVVGVAGLGTGLLVGGVGGRIVMRISSLLSPDVSGSGVRSEQGFRVGEVTLGGSIAFVIFIGVFVGLLGALVYAVTRPWLLRLGRWHGAGFGLFLFLVGSASSDALNPDNRDFFILDNVGVIVALFFLLFIGFGVAMHWFYGVVNRRLPSLESGSPELPAPYIAASVLGLLMVAGVVPTTFFTSSNCGCEPPIVVGIGFMVLAVVTISLWWSVRGGAGARTLRGLEMIGWVALGVTAATGAVRAIADVSDILAL
jgi:hypothetical protein